MIIDLLRGRFPEREYIIMEEVRDNAGFDAGRSADFIAVNTWPSRGLAIHGLEMKASRSDWLRELKDPRKAESILKFCDYFWLLTKSDDVARLEEIPSNWGWLSVKGEKLQCKKDAPKLEPRELTRGFFIAMLKRSSDKTNYVHRDSIKDEITKAKESAEQMKGYRVEQMQKERDELAKRIYDFEKASGVKLDRWKDQTKIGEAVAFLSNGGVPEIEQDLKRLESRAKEIHNQISHVLNSLNPVETIERNL